MARRPRHRAATGIAVLGAAALAFPAAPAPAAPPPDPATAPAAAPASASAFSSQFGNGAARAVDGDPGTRWASSWSDNQSITVDLGSARTVGRVVLHWEAASAKSASPSRSSPPTRTERHGRS